MSISVKLIDGVTVNPVAGSFSAPLKKCKMSASDTSSLPAKQSTYRYIYTYKHMDNAYIPEHSVTYSVQCNITASSAVRLLLPWSEYLISMASSK